MLTFSVSPNPRQGSHLRKASDNRDYRFLGRRYDKCDDNVPADFSSQGVSAARQKRWSGSGIGPPTIIASDTAALRRSTRRKPTARQRHGLSPKGERARSSFLLPAFGGDVGRVYWLDQSSSSSPNLFKSSPLRVVLKISW